jgi:hypothetical protein
VCLVAYDGMFDNYLFNDDFVWLREAQQSMDLSNVLTHRVIGFFRPLVNVSFFLMERISHDNVLFHYVFNFILHFLNTILVFQLISILFKDRVMAGAAAILFAATSVHPGAVLWISARTTLLSTALLLASFITLTCRQDRSRFRLVVSLIFYSLALAAKETAISGLLLVALIYFVTRNQTKHQLVTRGALIAFTIISAVYFLTRILVMERLFQDNWGLGLHIWRNIAGGFLYQVYPWPFFAILLPRATHIPISAHPFMPEIVIVPVVLFFLWHGRDMKMTRRTILAVGWSLLALVPMSLFRYRFFSTASFTQDRYYYLSSVGTVLLIVLLLLPLWRSKKKLRRIASVALLAFMCAGYMLHIDVIEKRWDIFTGRYHELVSAVLYQSDRHPGLSTLAIKNSPMPMRYLRNAVSYQRPGFVVKQIDNAETELPDLKPCLYISFTGEYPLLRMTAERIE